MDNKIKIYKAFQAYGTYLDRFYAANNGLDVMDYKTQLSTLRDDGFPWVLTWGKFNEDDVVEIFETIPNAYPLQKSWIPDIAIETDNWKKRAIINQIKEYQPNVCLIYPPEEYGRDFIDEIRSVVHHDVLIGGYDGMNRMEIGKYDGYDFVITCSRFICDYYTNNNKNTYALEFGFDPDTLHRITKRSPIYKVGFSGSVFPKTPQGGHQERYDLLSHLIRQVPLTVSSEYMYGQQYNYISRKALRYFFSGRFSDFRAARLFCMRNIGPRYGSEMFQFLSDSAISLNMHGDGIHFAANVRLYETTGVGSCLLTDWKKNIAEIFEPDKEIVTYTSKEEACDKIRFLLAHDDIRETIAMNGQKRTLSDYSYKKRVKGVIEYIKQLLQ